jgi:hypothetical protein
MEETIQEKAVTTTIISLKQCPGLQWIEEEEAATTIIIMSSTMHMSLRPMKWVKLPEMVLAWMVSR